LPPLLARGVDGSIQRVRGENPPLGIYPYEIRISTLSLAGVADLFVFTDGVSDAELLEGGSYREILENDFQEAPTLAALQRRFKLKTEQGSLDDLTLLHLRRLDIDSDWNWRVNPDLSLPEISRSIREFLDALALATVLDDVERDELELTLTEALTNALEHGCLGIDREEKTRLQLVGEYDDALAGKTARQDAGITFSATVWRGTRKPLLLLEISDNGPGLPADVMNMEAEITSVNGRGLRMISSYNDSVFIGSPGGYLIILKTLEGKGDILC
jgi:anti-sigma regulatory factor (Ser/Thr protein kinase)